MSEKNQRPSWGLLYLVTALLMGLILIELRLPLSKTGHRVVEVGTVLLIYGFVLLWLKGNEVALLREEREKWRSSLQDALKPLSPQSISSSHTKVTLDSRPQSIWESIYGWLVALPSVVAALLAHEGSMLNQFRPAIVVLALFTLITGLVYPVVVTGFTQLLFPRQANGSLIEQDGQILGSELIGQPFDDPSYFWGRLSATASFPYNAAASSGSNLGPTNPALVEAAQARVEALKAADPGNTQPIPVDLVTASGSGLDPHISIAAAIYQAPRVARERGLSEGQVLALVTEHSEGRVLGFLGEPRVNVLELNLALNETR